MGEAVKQTTGETLLAEDLATIGRFQSSPDIVAILASSQRRCKLGKLPLT